MPILIPILVLHVVLLIIALIDLYRRRKIVNYPIAWAIAILLFNTIGPILYLIIGRRLIKLIEIKHVNKMFRGRKILKNISFNISEGECIGLLGPNGAGKTTLIKCITGIINYEKGKLNLMEKIF